MKRSWFTLLLMALYPVVFHLWSFSDPENIARITLTVLVFLTAGLIWAADQGYFLNRFDLGLHVVVLLDLLVEGLGIPFHEGISFYGCALGFLVVLVAYRESVFRTKRSPSFAVENCNVQ
jgi:hypothetical protein